MKTIIATLGLALAGVATPALAQQFTTTPAVLAAAGTGSSYTGPIPRFGDWGALEGGGYNAFDLYGVWQGVAPQLDVIRRTELLAGTNTYRFLDTFTNRGTTTYTGRVIFFGDLGSDQYLRVLQNGGGTMVSCEDRGAGCINDPVVALAFGRTATTQVQDGTFRATYDLTLTPGQSGSILNFAFLARDLAGPDAASQALAVRVAADLASAPMVTGLADSERAGILNFDVAAVASAVPEPASWATMLVGVGVIGGGARRRRAARKTVRFA